MRMAKHFPNEYDFYPKTWVLPHQTTDLRTYCAKNNKLKVTYIVKPDSLCQGKGIFLSRSIDEMLDKMTHNELLDEYNIDSDWVGYVVQQYVDKPHLIDDVKYDLRDRIDHDVSPGPASAT